MYFADMYGKYLAGGISFGAYPLDEFGNRTFTDEHQTPNHLRARNYIYFFVGLTFTAALISQFLVDDQFPT